ncbi:hypothetical protein GCM10029964_046770 [Kibdelosporangium lantanae]
MSSPRLHRARPPLTRREPPRPALGLAPGLRLRSAVLLAQAAIDAATDPTGDLRGALAYTAAVGEISMVAPAAEAVRDAVRHLTTGAWSKARAALITAEKHLVSQPPVGAPFRT